MYELFNVIDRVGEDAVRTEDALMAIEEIQIAQLWFRLSNFLYYQSVRLDSVFVIYMINLPIINF